jgi:hypothetical protein
MTNGKEAWRDGAGGIIRVFLVCTLWVTPVIAAETASADSSTNQESVVQSEDQQRATPPASQHPGTPAKEPNDDDHDDVTGSFLEIDDFPKSVKIPGSDFSFKFGGYVKLDVITSFDPIGSEDDFQTNTIPIEGTPESALGGFVNFHAKESRFNFDIRSPTPVGNFRAFIEIDFYGPNGSTAPHLRHAYGVIGHFLGGQTWTTFMDISARPVTIDFEGADSSIFIRQALARWEQPAGDRFRWAVALEDPSPELTISGGLDGEARAEIPDVVGRVRYDWGKSHTQLAVIGRQIRYASTSGDVSGTGWGFNYTGIWMLGDAKRDSFMWQVQYGEGVGRYVHSFTGTGSDAVVAANGELQILPVESYVVGYRHFWTPNLRTGFVMAIARLGNQPGQPDDAIQQTQSPHLNLVWSPWGNFDVGGEIMWGERKNKDGSKGDASRLQLMAKWRFP